MSSHLPVPRRRFLRAALLGAALVALTVVGIAVTERVDSRRAVLAAMAEGARLDDSLSSVAAAERGDRVGFPVAIALAYLTRAEVGLGSPFRLVDLARSDPRLPAAWRPRVGYAILARLQRDHRVMRPMSGAMRLAVAVDSGAADALLAFVDTAMSTSDAEALVNLQALRLAAAQASAGGIMRPGAVALVDAAALMTLDRSRARRDLRRAVAAAAGGDGDLLQLLSEWRAQRRLVAERPLLADPAPASQRIVARIPVMLAGIERAVRSRSAPYGVRPEPVLPQTAARAMSLLISVRTRPPQPQIRLSVMDVRLFAMKLSSLSTNMLSAATNEETLVMSLATVPPLDSTRAPLAAAATLLAAHGMRTLSQEPPYHPGVVSVRPADVANQLGLASLAFAADVPVSWQPFYARQFAQAVASVQLVFPRASFVGLNVKIGGTVKGGALAVHEPRTRTLTLPIASGAGAIGHELIHDLDWQVARDVMGRRGTYATDNAARGRRSQPLAAPLARLAEFVPTGVLGSAYAAEARRPAELLARGADWFIAVALARQGRSDGAVSAVQDSWSRGYASAGGPVAFGDHAASLAALFDAMPVLALRTRAAPRTEGEAEADIGSIGRAAWFAALPNGDSVMRSTPKLGVLGLGELRLPSCAPIVRLRMDPMLRRDASVVVRGFLEPRVSAAMRRWARQADTRSLSDEAFLVRQALLGAPVHPARVDSARARWLDAAWRSLPCLLP